MKSTASAIFWRGLIIGLAAILFAAAVPEAGFAQSDPLIGTWKLNLAKSNYQAGQAPKSMNVVYEAAGAGIKVTVDTVPADGPAIHYSYTANFDGKDAKGQNIDSVAVYEKQ